MRGIHKIFTRTATAGALLASLGIASGAKAQSTWSLPDPTATATPRAQGPVDAQNPVTRPIVTAPSPTPVPTITPPAPTPSATRAAPSPAPTQAPRDRASATPRPVATPSPTSTPTPRATATAEATLPPEASPTPLPSPQATTAAAPDAGPSEAPAIAPASPQASESWPFWWWAVPLALLVAAGLIVLLRRRGAEPEAPEWEETAAVAEQPAPEPAPAIARAQPVPTPPGSAPAAPPVAAPRPPAAAPSAEVEIAFEPVALRLSLVYATLQYRLTIAAGAALPGGHLLGDMIGAHGSIPVDQQLAPAPEGLAHLKTLPPIAAGESATVTGELQLPLGAIVPVRQGNASLFVPLVRMYLVPDDGTPGLRRVFTVGTIGGSTGGAALAPVRLDTGPNEHRTLAAREVEAARGYPVPGTIPRAVAG
jgi:hypothetical protein